MLHVHDAAQDTTDREIRDRPLAVNSCGTNTQPEGYAAGDICTVRRPAGRKDFQLILIETGSIRFFHGNTITEARAGSAFLYLPGTPQEYAWDVGRPLLSHWVHYSGSTASDITRRCGLDFGLFQTGCDKTLIRLFERISLEKQSSSPLGEELCSAMLWELLAFCGRRKTQGWNENTDRARLLISSAAEKIAREWARNEPVETYAALCGFDIYRFTHEFSALYGVSPLQYRISIRLRHASEYLKGTALSVRDIAELCGYDDPLYFSRIFAKRFGISPREFRKENRKEERSESASG